MNKQWPSVATTVLLLLNLNLSAAFGENRKLQRIPEGTWGAPHITMQVSSDSATIEYDCAHGTITGPLKLDRRGRFSLTGTHVQEHPGPIRVDEESNDRPARYTGWTDGKTLTLTVTLTDTNKSLGTYTLRHGNAGRVFKCL